MKNCISTVFLGFLLVASTFGWSRELPVNTRMGGDFELESTLGKNVKLSSYQGKVVLLNFGYTSCPDVCPMVLSRIGRLLGGLGNDRKDVQTLFVSFDPKRDTIDYLEEYLVHFDSSIIGLTGDEAQVAEVARLYGAYYMKEKSDSALGQLYAHTDYIYLLDRQGRIRALFSSSQPMSEMKSDLLQIIDEG